LIEEGQALADFARCVSDHCVGVGVVVWDPAEDFDANRSFFDLVAVAGERQVDYIA
jgi:hypothetical protein